MSAPNLVTVTTQPCSCQSVPDSFARHRDGPATHSNGPSPKSRASPNITDGSAPLGWPECMKVIASTTTAIGAIGHAVILEGRVPDFYHHRWPATVLSFGLRGQAKVEWKRGGRLSRFVVAPGGFTIVPAGEDNSFCMDRPLQTLNLVYSPDQLHALADRECIPDSPTIEIAPVQHQTTQEVIALGQAFAGLLRAPRPGSVLYAETLWTQIAIQLLWSYSSLPRQCEARAERLSDPRLQRVIDYCHASLDSEVSLGELADVACLSPNYFLNALKKATGKTPHRFLTEIRVAKACELLRNPQISIVQVALAVGYSSQSHLTTVFGRLMKTTPASYRAEVLDL
jgi:AraC family transcriptional regulator